MEKLEERVRDLEISDRVHSINTKRLDIANKEVTTDIKTIKESLNINIGKKEALSIFTSVIIATIIGFISWEALQIFENSRAISRHEVILR